ncbi:helix-turn-helix domain-containing protein [Cysteiniphilum sp. 6C5]|uniref:helix-turn-helix domain-containing protein n=1 Tax=unclassified Cysteiniphilum TaxID=2610889 RepID=UPI003F875578
MANIVQQLSHNIFNLMRQHGIKSVSELARQVGCSATTIYNITSQTNKNPSIETIKMLADFFEVSIDDFVRHNLVDNANKLKKSSRLCPVITKANLAQFITGNYQDDDSKVTEIANNQLSTNAFAIELDQNIAPYQTGNVLIFDYLNFEEIAFPSLCIIKSKNNYTIQNIYQIDGNLYLKIKQGIFNKKDMLIPLDDEYSNAEIIAALVEVKLYH